MYGCLKVGERMVKALIDCTGGKSIRLLLNGERVPGIIRPDKITKSGSNNEAREIQITILASDLKIKTFDGKAEKIHQF